jgi:Alpha-L-arabinofuranosidase B, catalytic
MRKLLTLRLSALIIAAGLCVPASAQFNGGGGFGTPGFTSPKAVASTPLLLDTLSVSPTVAYSTRKLRAAYAGSDMLVQRDSDSAQLAIGFVAGQLDAATLLAFCGSASCGVITWFDQSGNGNNAAAGNSPLIAQSSSVFTLHGNPASRFGVTGPSNNMQVVLGISQPTTIAFAAQYNSLVTSGDYSDGLTGSPRELIGVGAGTPPTQFQQFGGSTALFGGTLDLLSHAYFGIFNGASSSLTVDGTTVISGNPGTDGIGCCLLELQMAAAVLSRQTASWEISSSSIPSLDRPIEGKFAPASKRSGVRNKAFMDDFCCVPNGE